ncbi:MAG: FecR family protein, partial [Desulfarculales bacterium]|nr:FecR family protein [Desulfarculales bacterium]
MTELRLNKKSGRWLAVLPLLLLSPALAAGAQDLAGEIISFTPGAALERNGGREAVELNAPVYAGDVILTDASGRVRIWLNDDSVVSLGPDTVYTLEEYEPEGSGSVFHSNLGQGLVRVLTGKIVEANPQGFSVITPEATVGIRGTIVSVRSQNGVSTVYVENTLRQVLVNGVDTPSGHKAVISSSGALPAIEVIQPQDRRDLGRDLAFAGGRGTAAAAPEPGLIIAGPGDILNTLTTLEDAEEISLPSLALNDMMNPNVLPPTPPMTGYVAGILDTSLYGNTFNGAFNFDVSLASGAISNGSLSGNGTVSSGTYAGALAVNLTGGTGTATSGALGYFAMDSFLGGSVTYGGGTPVPPGYHAHVKGPVDLLSAPSGISFPVDYDFEDNSSVS